MLPFAQSFPGFRATDGTVSFPVVESTNNYSRNTSSATNVVTLPSGIASGDLVILQVSGGSTAATTNPIQLPAGWTTLYTNIKGGMTNPRWTHVMYIVATGAMSNVTVTYDAASTCTSCSYRISGFTETPTGTGNQIDTSTTAPNPGSHTVPVGWGSNPHVLWITFINTGVTTVTAPSGYGNKISPGSSSYNSAHSARKELQATSDDPGTWSLTSGQASQMFTLGVRGAIAA